MESIRGLRGFRDLVFTGHSKATSKIKKKHNVVPFLKGVKWHLSLQQF